MENITNIVELKYAIKQLEDKQSMQGLELKEQFNSTYESLKPINLIKTTIEEITSTPSLADNISGTLIGVVSGYLTKKVVTGKSHNAFRSLFGVLMQIGVTNVVSKHSDTIKSGGQLLYQYIINKIQSNSEVEGQD